MRRAALTTVLSSASIDFSFDKDKEMGTTEPVKMDIEEEHGGITFEMKESS